MSDSLSYIRSAKNALGLTLSDERLEALTAALEAALKQTETIRGDLVPPPAPTAFDAGWGEKK